MSDSRLLDIGQSILDSVADGLTLEGIDVPGRQYLHTGQIAYDLGAECDEAFIVAWDGFLPGVPSSTSARVLTAGTPIFCAVPLVAQYTILLLRCVPSLDPDGNFPKTSELQASGERLLLDAMTMARVIVDEQLAGTLTQLNCTFVGFGNVTAVGPLGGIGGVSMDLFVSLV